CSIANRDASHLTEKYMSDIPNITGIFEIHIFLTPLNPSQKVIDAYLKVTDKINNLRKDDEKFSKIKPCLLALDFKDAGFVTVMQSSRYFVSDNVDNAIKEMQRESKM